MKQLTITPNDAGQRLDRFLSKALPLLPEGLLQKYIRLKRVKVNGAGAKRDARIEAGDILELYINDEFFEKPSDKNAHLKIAAPRLDIVYEDQNLLLLNKPAGQLCHSDGAWEADTLIAHVQAHVRLNGAWNPHSENSFAPALCNRIDRNTGGLVVAAKNAEALRILNEKIRGREIDKYYLCAVFGAMNPPSGRLENYLFKDAVKNRVYVRSERGPGTKTAVTEYRTLCKNGGLSLLECRLLTGRTHQIRAQLAHAGHPLLGDGKYGSERKNRACGEKHQALWSYKLVFTFPTDAGALNYLRGKTFTVPRVDFAERYFEGKYLRL
ncbi:MAG: RluA family pseudouridine synthase [Firmicutes bacterium]|nr:RluA family pseudouridine synthase [Bacillota bacterium]